MPEFLTSFPLEWRIYKGASPLCSDSLKRCRSIAQSSTLDRMELRQLKYFLELVRVGNFNRAAETLHITQPALSKSMRTLEGEIGAQLLERGPAGVVPTIYGRLLAEYASLATRELKRGVEELRSLVRDGGGTIRIGGGTSVLQYLMPETCRRLFAADSRLRIQLVDGLRNAVVAGLVRGDIDVVICPHDGEESLAGIKEEVLLRDEVTVVAHRSHPLFAKASIDTADLAAYRWIIPSVQERERKTLALRLAQAGLPAPDVSIETSSSSLMAQLLVGQTFLSYLPKKLMNSDPVFADLRPVPVSLSWPGRDLSMLYRDGSLLLPAMQTVLQVFRDVARDFGASGRAKTARARSAKK